MTYAGRWMTSPTVKALCRDRLRPRTEGTQPTRLATSTIRALVSSDTPGRPLRAADTDEMEMPVSAATPTMVTRRFIGLRWFCRRSWVSSDSVYTGTGRGPRYAVPGSTWPTGGI
jgi:hypothetical protein